jgi:hypothetical protein
VLALQNGSDSQTPCVKQQLTLAKKYNLVHVSVKLNLVHMRSNGLLSIVRSMQLSKVIGEIYFCKSNLAHV